MVESSGKRTVSAGQAAEETAISGFLPGLYRRNRKEEDIP